MNLMRRMIVGLLACVLAAACLWPASADAPADATRTFVWTGEAFTSEDTTAAFWEFPQLKAGQTRRDGALNFTNRSGGSVTLRLTEVQFPYDDQAAIGYLNALHLTLRDGDRVLYDGAFVRLNDDGLTEAVTLKNGETRTLSVDLSCDFAYEGAVTCGEQVMYWNWAASSSWLGFFQTALDAWVFWVPALVILAVIIVLIKNARKRTAPGPSYEQAPGRVPAAPSRPAAPRRKAAHAAPRHAKKK